MVNFDQNYDYPTGSELLDLYYKAEIISKKVHAGQLYGKKDYFNYHIKGVENNVIEFLKLNNVKDTKLILSCQIVAQLHDSIEDSDGQELTVDEEFLKSEGFPPYIIKSLKLITKEDGYDRQLYIPRIRKDLIARIVKISDALFNYKSCVMSLDKPWSNKYDNYLTGLLEEL